MSGSKPPLLENATRDLAAFAARLRFEDIPRDAIEHMKYCVLDSIGCCLFGVTLPWTRHVQAEGGAPAASIFGGGRTSVSQAGGLMAAQEGAMIKRFHSGRAGQSGVYAALLAKREVFIKRDGSHHERRH